MRLLGCGHLGPRFARMHDEPSVHMLYESLVHHPRWRSIVPPSAEHYMRRWGWPRAIFWHVGYPNGSVI